MAQSERKVREFPASLNPLYKKALIYFWQSKDERAPLLFDHILNLLLVIDGLRPGYLYQTPIDGAGDFKADPYESSKLIVDLLPYVNTQIFEDKNHKATSILYTRGSGLSTRLPWKDMALASKLGYICPESSFAIDEDAPKQYFLARENVVNTKGSQDKTYPLWGENCAVEEEDYNLYDKEFELRDQHFNEWAAGKDLPFRFILEKSPLKTWT